MKIFVKIKPNAKTEKVIQIDGTHFEVWVKEPPIQGRANAAVIQVLAGHLKIPKSGLTIVAGKNSRKKVILI